MAIKAATMTRFGTIWAFWGLFVASGAATATDFSRFQGIIDRRPFGEIEPIVTETVTNVVPGGSLAKDYELKGIIDDGEKMQVGLFDKKTNKHIYLEIGQEINGVQLISANYDLEEATLKMDNQLSILKLRPDKDQDKGPATTGLASLPVSPTPLSHAMTASPFNQTNQSGQRLPFFSDIKKRGSFPFQRMGTNTAFQSRSLQSFFKPNTNASAPFVSPFRMQASPFQPVSPADAGQPGPALSFPPAPVPASDQGVINQPAQPGPPAPAMPEAESVPMALPATLPGTEPEISYEIYEIEE